MVEHDATVDGAPATASESATDGSAALGSSDAFAALQHSRRRYVLHALANESEQTLTELATDVVAWEQDKCPEQVTDAERNRCRTSLYHSHVPKLADVGVVEYETGDEVLVRAADDEWVRAMVGTAGGETDGAWEARAD